jgi:hypothetical protein
MSVIVLNRAAVLLHAFEQFPGGAATAWTTTQLRRTDRLPRGA